MGGAPGFRMPPELKLEQPPLKVEPTESGFDTLQGFTPSPTAFAPPPTRVLNSVQRSMTPPKHLSRPTVSDAQRAYDREPRSPTNPHDVPPHKRGMRSAVKKRRKPRIIKPQPLCWGPAPKEPKETEISAVKQPYESALRLFKSG